MLLYLYGCSQCRLLLLQCCDILRHAVFLRKFLTLRLQHPAAFLLHIQLVLLLLHDLLRFPIVFLCRFELVFRYDCAVTHCRIGMLQRTAHRTGHVGQQLSRQIASHVLKELLFHLIVRWLLLLKIDLMGVVGACLTLMQQLRFLFALAKQCFQLCQNLLPLVKLFHGVLFLRQFRCGISQLF